MRGFCGTSCSDFPCGFYVSGDKIYRIGGVYMRISVVSMKMCGYVAQCSAIPDRGTEW